jgi:pyruvate carboxylase subunit B
VRYIVTVLGREIEVEVDGEQVTVAGRSHTATLSHLAGIPVRQLLLDSRSEALAVESIGGGRWAITRHGERYDLEVVDERTRYIRKLTGTGDRSRGPAALKAPMPGLVVRIQVEPGQSVTAGAGIVVLEAMKMENELRASAPAVIKSVHARLGEAVEKGQILVEFD